MKFLMGNIRIGPRGLLAAALATVLCSRSAAEIVEINGWKLEVSIKMEKAVVMMGEPTWFTFRVHNHSTDDLEVLVGGDYQNGLGRPDSFKVKVTGSEGSAVAQPRVGPVMGGWFGPQKLPAKGNYDFILFMPHWATFEKPGKHTIVCARKLSVIKPGSFFSPQRKTFDVDVQTSGHLEVVPADWEKLGVVIEALGRRMGTGSWDEKETAAKILDAFNDERVIPFFKRAIETDDPAVMGASLNALGKYASEDAFQGLKRGMAISAANISNATTAKVAAQAAEGMRHRAAFGLTRCKHPEAIPFLLKHRSDESEAVRITILHVLGKLDTKESLDMLVEMANDKSELVSTEAKRYVALRSKVKSP